MTHMNPRSALAAFLVGTLTLAFACTPAFASYVPYGSYVRSCRQIHTEGPDLVAFCARVDGSWKYSRFFMPNCGVNYVSNHNGHLTCGE